MFDWFQEFWDWLSEQVAVILAQLDFVQVIIGLAEIVASYLPAPDPRLAGIIDQMVSFVSIVAKWIALLDYFVNMPVLIAVLSIMLATETTLLVLRGWRIIRSFIT